MKFDTTSISTAFQFSKLTDSRLKEIENLDKKTICDIREEARLALEKYPNNMELMETIYATYLAYRRLELPYAWKKDLTKPFWLQNA